jgi:Na+-transporting NADH:ubiquinone oxidoreductase subunit C
MQRDSAGHIFTVAALVCLVCATAVSSSAVLLRDRQRVNRLLARQENILVAAGLWEPDRRLDPARLDESMQAVEARMVDLEEGWYTDAADPAEFEARRAARDPATSIRLARDEDAAGIVRRERLSPVYLVARDGRLDQVILPVRGYGLWSTMWAFLALDAESIARGAEHVTVRGVTFYEHGETPGLGGEIENPRWQQRWEGKRVFDPEWRVVLEVTKQADPQSDVEIDALSGATITSNGVDGMLRFWLGPLGFGPYLRRLHEELKGTTDEHG